ncbi:uncharacterized protein A4U43_UnF9060 [Asparagus officinalis]|uniref:Beta-glucosidase n=1 Tax=Asparagus officinalis TaxID=4686 RepID=A0A1R3L5S7_ASPOF|nr:uncharacterized protein A4U43_UnF9060 [Asparagus officinalis]
MMHNKKHSSGERASLLDLSLVLQLLLTRSISGTRGWREEPMKEEKERAYGTLSRIIIQIADHQNGDVAVDSYHRYKEDIKILKDMGADAYRFSIAWSRILPKGNLAGGINHEGIDYYNNLINEQIENGIKPFVTIFHWDVPQALEDKYGGFLDREIVDDFKDYCEVCFKEFGDRVKNWVTVNEPWSFSTLGYGLGYHAPGRCSQDLGCQSGDSLREPYTVSHNLILAHAVAFRLYNDKFKDVQKGEVGISLISYWFKPYSNCRPDYEAAIRSLDFMLGWYMEPLAFGDYPFIMRAVVKDRLPYFTDEETEIVKDSYDFIGVNYYTTRYARNIPSSQNFIPEVNLQEAYASKVGKKDNVPLGKLEGTWIYVYPEGLKELLLELKNRYNNPKIYITENGTCELDDSTNILTLEEALHDEERIEYYALHLASVKKAIRCGVNVKGFFAWSLLDNFEWNGGYTNRFGLTYIDYKNNLKRYPKKSNKWLTNFLKV